MPSYEYHPLADVVPVDPKVVRAISGDIRENGLKDPIVLFEGMILDGRHRHLACTAVYREPVFEEFAGTYEDARKFVIRKNLLRNHLDESQRAMAAAKLAKMKRGRPEKVSKETITDLSLAEAADELKVSRATVARAKKVLTEGTPELVSKVEAGEIAVTKAAQIAALPAEKQAAAIERHERKEAKAEQEAVSDRRLDRALSAYDSLERHQQDLFLIARGLTRKEAE